MNFKRIGNKRDEVLMTVVGADTNGTIPVGCPAILQYNGTDDGLAVILPSTAGQTQSDLCFYGVNLQQLPQYTQGVVMATGYTRSGLLVVQTRAASTAVWAATTIAQFGPLGIDTVNNAFKTIATTNGQPWGARVIALDSSLSMASSASSTADTRTVITSLARVQVRNM